MLVAVGRKTSCFLCEMSANGYEHPGYVAMLLNCAQEVLEFTFENGTLVIHVVVPDAAYAGFHKSLKCKAGLPPPAKQRSGCTFQHAATVRVESVPAEYAALIGIGLEHVAAIAIWPVLQSAAAKMSATLLSRAGGKRNPQLPFFRTSHGFCVFFLAAGGVHACVLFFLWPSRC